MTTQSTNLNVKIVTPDKKEDDQQYSCGLNWEIEDEDNGGSTSHQIGKASYIRLFKGSDLSNLTILTTSGSIQRYATGQYDTVGNLNQKDDPIYLTFTNSNSTSLSLPYYYDFNYEAIGNFFDINGNVISEITVYPSENSVNLSKNVFGVLRISYTTSYDLYAYTPAEYGSFLIIAKATCPSGEIITATIEISVEEENDDDTTYSCNLKSEIVSSDNLDGDGEERSGYRPGITYYLRLYKGGDIESVISRNTNGEISLSASGVSAAIEDEEINFTGSDTASFPSPYKGGFSYEKVGKFYNLSGEEVAPSFVPTESSLLSSIAGFGVIKVSYSTEYDKYQFSFDEVGEAVLALFSECGGSFHKTTQTISATEPSSSQCCSSCSCSSSTKYTDITVVFKDFVTGAVLQGVTVFLDNTNKGQTDENGSITLKNVEVGKAYSIKGTKDGYLNTDSDSLSNDEFIIQES